MSNNANYPNKLKGLLMKANLIGHGRLEVRSVRVSKTVTTAEAYEGSEALSWEKKEVSLDEDVQRGWTNPVDDGKGNIAGYWASGLTRAEQELIHHEGNVPYFYLNHETKKDTIFNLFDGKRYDMTIPSHVAEVRCLYLGTYIGHNKQDAMDNDCEFYFFSAEEEQAAKKKRNSRRREAVKLIDNLSVDQKREVVRMMHFLGSINVDPYISGNDSEILFEDLAYDKSLSLMKAYEHPNKFEHIVIYSLVNTGVIEVGGDTGPYYKAPSYFGSKVLIADDLTKCYKAILAEHEVMAMYKKLEQNNSIEPYVQAKSKDILEGLYSQHIVTEDGEIDSDENPMIEVIRRSNKKTLLKMLADENLPHKFDDNTDLITLRTFCIENLTNGN